MPHSYKAEIAHMLDNGDKLELEAHLEADGHDEAFAMAQNRFDNVLRQLAAAGSPEIDRTKIERTG